MKEVSGGEGPRKSGRRTEVATGLKQQHNGQCTGLQAELLLKNRKRVKGADSMCECLGFRDAYFN